MVHTAGSGSPELIGVIMVDHRQQDAELVARSRLTRAPTTCHGWDMTQSPFPHFTMKFFINVIVYILRLSVSDSAAEFYRFDVWWVVRRGCGRSVMESEKRS